MKEASRKLNKEDLIRKAPLNTKINIKINQTGDTLIKCHNSNK